MTSSVAPDGQVVSLPGSALDWIAADPQSVTGVIRRKSGGQPLSGPHRTGDPAVTLTRGPFAVSWAGGMPASRGSASRIWLTVTAPAQGPETGLIIRVPAARAPSELTLRVGASGVDGQIRSQLDGDSKVTLTTLKATSGGGSTVRLRFHADAPGGGLTVRLLAGAGGSVSLAAASLN